MYKSTLGRAYGLTPAMIAELGDPDRSCANPHWKTGPYDASLYSVRRVEAWVAANRERVERAWEERARRSAAALAALARKREDRRQAALEWVRTVEIKVEGPLPDTLLEDAGRAHPSLSDKGLRAHVRHRLTNYDLLLREVNRHEFATELYPILRRRTDDAAQAAIDEWRGRSR